MSGRSYANIARAVGGITAETITRLIKGTLKPSDDLARRIAALLDVDDADALFALAAPVRRLVAEAIAAGVLVDDDAADRLAAILAGSGVSDAITA